jgi:predicted acetyltransferase
MGLILRTLTLDDEAAFFEGMNEWAGESPHWYSFKWKDGMSYAEMLDLMDKESRGEDLAPGRVPHTMYYGFVDGKIIGRMSLRHELNESLRYRGGHIGYAVAPRFRQKGYATEMVRQVLPMCRGLGLKEIMITCADDNVASWRVIEKFGGVLKDKIWDDVDSEMIRRYWLTLPPEP